MPVEWRAFTRSVTRDGNGRGCPPKGRLDIEMMVDLHCSIGEVDDCCARFVIQCPPVGENAVRGIDQDEVTQRQGWVTTTARDQPAVQMEHRIRIVTLAGIVASRRLVGEGKPRFDSLDRKSTR